MARRSWRALSLDLYTRSDTASSNHHQSSVVDRHTKENSPCGRAAYKRALHSETFVGIVLRGGGLFELFEHLMGGIYAEYLVLPLRLHVTTLVL